MNVIVGSVSPGRGSRTLGVVVVLDVDVRQGWTQPGRSAGRCPKSCRDAMAQEGVGCWPVRREEGRKGCVGGEAECYRIPLFLSIRVLCTCGLVMFSSDLAPVLQMASVGAPHCLMVLQYLEIPDGFVVPKYEHPP